MSSLLHKAADPHIDPENPWDNDDFQRREYGERLTRLVTNTPGSFVIALKAPWGAGKSIFLKRWEAHLELPKTVDKPKVPVVHVDAWRSDYLADPLLAFIDAVAERARRDQGAMPRIGDALSTFARFGARIAAPVVRVAAAVGSAGVTEMLPVASESLESFAGHWLERAEEHRKSEEGFREGLEKLRDVLCEKPEDTAVPTVPLVVVIDELDRCRPDFAIKALERIKHFFGVPGIVFVIATDGDNLPSAVKTLYGGAVDGERYLRKFFDFEFRIPPPSQSQVLLWMLRQAQFIHADLGNTDEEVAKFAANYSFGDHSSRSLEERVQRYELIEYFARMTPAFALTPRDCIQAFTLLIAVARSAAPRESLVAPLLVAAICSRYSADEFFEQLLLDQARASQLFHVSTGDSKRAATSEKLRLLMSGDSYGSALMKLAVDTADKTDTQRDEEIRKIQRASHEKRPSYEAASGWSIHSAALGRLTPNQQVLKLLSSIGVPH